MKVKTSKLTGTQLDYAVAECEGFEIKFDPMGLNDGSWWIAFRKRFQETRPKRVGGSYSPSTDWAQGGPIIAGEQIDVVATGGSRAKPVWGSKYWDEETACVRSMHGSTPLEAAMRCYVASKLGDEIELPDELSV